MAITDFFAPIAKPLGILLRVKLTAGVYIGDLAGVVKALIFSQSSLPQSK